MPIVIKYIHKYKYFCSDREQLRRDNMTSFLQLVYWEYNKERGAAQSNDVIWKLPFISFWLHLIAADCSCFVSYQETLVTYLVRAMLVTFGKV